MKENGCYIIKDSFFERFNDPYLKGNKDGNRPHYFCVKDYTYENLFWVIPLSSRADKYKSIILKKEKLGKRCDILHIVEINNRENVFLIQDIFPITEDYISREYTINGQHLFIWKDNKIIKQKAKNIIRLIHRGVKFGITQPDVLKIKAELIKDIEQSKRK